MMCALVALLVLARSARAAATYWVPSPTTTFQWELDDPIDPTVDDQFYDIDLFNNDASVVAQLHSLGRHVICYLDAGSWENYRPDASEFPASVLGNDYAGYSNERWLDIRQLSILEPIMTARIQMCHDKGFDGVEFDNIDGYENDTGFPLTYDEQATYDEWLANEAHSFNLNVAMKSDVDQVSTLEPYFDWNLDEQCYDYSECSELEPFTAAGKAVEQIEYAPVTNSEYCSAANSDGFMGQLKSVDLTSWQSPCWATGNWVGRTGSDGYDLAGFSSGNDLSSLPNASVSLVQGSRTVWASSTTDIRALESPDGSTRTAAAWSDPSAVKLNLTFNSGYTGDLHLYIVDWDSTARRETITVGNQTSSEPTTGDFGEGQWISFPISAAAGQTIPITVTASAGASAVLSGLFLSDDLVFGSSPQGNWVNTFGTTGYDLAAWNGGSDVTNMPSGDTVSLIKGTPSVWATGTSDPRALESSDTKSRNAAAWTDPNEVEAQVKFGSAYTGDLEVYAVDWNAAGLREAITVASPTYGSQTEPLSSDFSQGGWVVFPVDVAAGQTLTVTAQRTAGASAVLSGIFLN